MSSPFCSQPQKVLFIFPIFRYLNLPPGLLSCTCTLEFLRILIITSRLLIVLADREGNHWVLTTLLFIRGLLPHPSQWTWGNVGVSYKLLGIWDIPIHLSPSIPESILISPPLWGGFTLLSSLLGQTWPLIYWDAYNHLMWLLGRHGYLVSGKHQSCRT